MLVSQKHGSMFGRIGGGGTVELSSPAGGSAGSFGISGARKRARGEAPYTKVRVRLIV